MFDLEQSIAEWRRRMLAAGVNNSNVLDELEGHLRDDVERRMKSGLGADRAFEAAVSSIGQPVALKREFAKAAPTIGTRWQKLKFAVLKLLGLSVPGPQLFTVGALASLELGGREAIGFHHDFIGTEHVLLGLLESGSGAVCDVLRKMGIDRDVVRHEIEKIVGLGPEQPVAHDLRYTPRVKRSLALAASEAKSMKQNQIDAGHIFLGLLKEGGGVAPLVLKRLGLNFQTARDTVLAELGRTAGGV